MQPPLNSNGGRQRSRWAFFSGLLDEGAGARYRRAPRLHPELAEDLLEVLGYRARPRVQDSPDLRVGLALPDPVEHLRLARSKAEALERRVVDLRTLLLKDEEVVRRIGDQPHGEPRVVALDHERCGGLCEGGTASH